MFRNMVRKFKKSKPTHRDDINLDQISKKLTTKADLSMVFDLKKINHEKRLGQFVMILGPDANSPSQDDASLLFVYPAKQMHHDPSVFNRVKQFCYPRGMKKEHQATTIFFKINLFLE